jgi:hypothetical protein
MNAEMVDQLFVDSYLMMNLEITFSGVRSWFEMAGISTDDSLLFKALLFPEQITPDLQVEIAQMIVYRYEDIFFQVSRTDDSVESEAGPNYDVNEAMHQLLLRMMNVRSLKGTEDAFFELGFILQKDKFNEQPLYLSLHNYFQ